MRILRVISRIIVGLIFIFSGTVKAIDPLGSAYKFHDYFIAFNAGFLDFMSLPLSILLCTIEFFAGFSILTGIRHKEGIRTGFILMIIFTPLTLILALTNPVSDCGCFGDAIHLTNWQTFAKNIILLLMTIVLFLARNITNPYFRSGKEWVISGSVIVLFILFSIYNLIFLPVIDFLPYKKGIKIADKMIIPEGAKPDEYETTFIYEKDGVKKEFSLENYPADDSTWIFVDQKSVLIRKGYIPPIHDFMITSMSGDDITQQILEDHGYSLLMISKKLEDASEEHLRKGFETGRECILNGIDFYVITASGSDIVSSFDNGLNFCSADETTLKTMVRSNPGYILIKDGTISGKWSSASLPEAEWYVNLSDSKAVDHD
jgi:hypothetical protein